MTRPTAIYYALVHKEPDSAFGVTFPDLPGCFSAADDEADLIIAAQEALDLYALDGAPLAPPSPLEVFRSTPAVRRELTAGAVIVAVPLAKQLRRQSVAGGTTMSVPKASKAAKSAAASALTQAADKKPAAKKAAAKKAS